VAAIGAIDNLEQEYLQEYYLLKEKDKLAGKDFNQVIHDEMVKAQHHFDMLRKMERSNFDEQIRKKQ
jgi:hypothetical protein